MITDTHDRRAFRQFVKLNDDGTVAATTLIAVGSPEPTDLLLVDVTDQFPAPVDDLVVDPKAVEAVLATKTTVDERKAALVAAEQDHADARATLVATVEAAVLNAKAAAVKDPAPEPTPMVPVEP